MYDINLLDDTLLAVLERFHQRDDTLDNTDPDLDADFVRALETNDAGLMAQVRDKIRERMDAEKVSKTLDAATVAR